MTDVDATLVVDDGLSGTRALSVDDFKAAATGDATQVTAAAILAKLSGDPATQTTLAALLVQATAIAGSVDGLEGFTDGVEGKLDSLITALAGTLTVSGPLTDAQLRAAAVAISAVSLPLPTGAAQEHATAGSPHSARLTDGTTYIGSTAQRLHVDDGGSSLTVDGPLTDAQLRATAVPHDQTKINGTTVDTNSGSKSAGTQRVVLATDQPALTTPLPVERSVVASATLANVSSSASSVQLWASNSAARLRTIFNDSTAVLYVKFGTTASATDYVVKIAAGGYYELPNPLYTGRVDGIWASANGSARLTEA